MLKPAILYKDIIEEEFAKILYSEDYYFYCGYVSGEPFSLNCEDNLFNYAFVDKDDNVLGFLTYQIYDLADTVHNFGLISFETILPFLISFKSKNLSDCDKNICVFFLSIEKVVEFGNPTIGFSFSNFIFW